MARLKHLYQIKSNHGVRRRPWKHVIHRALCFRRYLCYRRPLCPSSAAFDIIVRGWCPRLPRLYVYCCGDSQLHQAQLSSTPKRWSKCQCFLGTLFRTYNFWKPPCPGGSFIPNAVVWPPYWWGLPAGASTTLKLCILPLPLWDGFFLHWAQEPGTGEEKTRQWWTSQFRIWIRWLWQQKNVLYTRYDGHKITKLTILYHV